MSKTNYKLRIRNGINKALDTGVMLGSRHKMSDRDSAEIIGFNAELHSSLCLAKVLLRDGEIKEAYTVLCDLPYHMRLFQSGLPVKKNTFMGTMATYVLLDRLRHYVRMQSLEAGTSEVGKGEIWNNVMVF